MDNTLRLPLSPSRVPPDKVNSAEWKPETSSLHIAVLDFDPYNTLSNEKLLELEIQTLNREMEFTLHHELPSILREVAKLLQQAMRMLVNPTSAPVIPNPDASPLDKVSALEVAHPSGVMRGSLSVDSWFLVNADLLIRQTKAKKNTSIRTVINANSPWLLSQVQNSHNFTLMARREMDILLHKQSGKHLDAMEHTEILTRVVNALRKAIDQLEFQPIRTFPVSSTTPVIHTSPPLPPDMFLDCALHHADIVLSLYSFSPAAQKPPQKLEVASNQTSAYKTQSLVAEVESVRVPYPPYKAALDFLQSAWSLCRLLREKTNTLALSMQDVPVTAAAR
eukprot:GILK01007463.1.p1 GENE.GILK01007463.1~~GILK01007463.1.p1  ORF type:complete len:336 (+),score=36.70 GILK01007463.1:31-1038(+)